MTTALWIILGLLVVFGIPMIWLSGRRGSGLPTLTRPAPPVTPAVKPPSKPHLVKMSGFWLPMPSRNNLEARPDSYVDDVCAAYQWADRQNAAARSFRETMARLEREDALRDITLRSK